MVQLATGLIALSVLTGFLALLLEVADSYFADYGDVRIDINQGDKVLTVEGGNKLLPSLMDQGIFIPSACGGRGSCGLCKVKVAEGGGPTLPTETPYLDDQELQDHVRLSCQIKVRSDIRMEIPPELFLVKEFQTKVISLQDLTEYIKEVRLELLEPAEMAFKPGQYVHFEVPEYEGSPEPIYRAYSIASPARTNNQIKLVIPRVPDGLATTMPLAMPIWALRGRPVSSARRSSAAWISSAARAERSGSSPWATGAPKTAMTLSPICLSTAPP